MHTAHLLAPPAPRSGSVVEPPESLLVLSDVHLGSSLNDHDAGTAPPGPTPIDRDLVDFLDHYRTAPPPGRRWRLVVAGDFIDFIGMAVSTDGEPLETEPDDEERAHGLGSAADHSRAKLRHVARAHEGVFRALAAFVEAGHALTMVHGNHDFELHWAAVQDELRRILRAHARQHAALDRRAFDGAGLDRRIEFHPWFFYVGGVAYIEHGHQYDPMCATEHVMAPLSAFDPRRLARGFSDVLLRYVVRPTRGLREHGHESMGIVDYLAFAARLGGRGMIALVVRFVRAIVALLRLRRGHFSDATAALRAEHDRRMHVLADATSLGIERLRALAALHAPPVTRSAWGVLRGLLVDALALHALGILLVLAVTFVTAFRAREAALAGVVVVGAWVLGRRWLAARRSIDPREALAERAHDVARLFPAPFVVMGHTHVPSATPVADGVATYVNLGSWAEDADPGATYRAARTHLVIHPAGGRPSGELRAWDPERREPQPFLPAA